MDEEKFATPRCDALQADHAIDFRSYRRLWEFARELERESYQTRMDACHDSKRLVDDKMKLWERVTDLERDLAATYNRCAEIAMAVDSGRGNESVIAASILRLRDGSDNARAK